MAFGKWVKKKAQQTTKAAGKRYGISYGRRGVRASKNSMSKIAKDVMMIKSQLNVEKKFVDTPEVIKDTVGQVRVNASGQSNFEITPSIVQGVQESQRVGNSIKCTGLVVKMNVAKQTAAGGPRRLKVMIVRANDPLLSPTDVYLRILDVNPITGVRDYHSNLDYTQLKDGRLKILRTANVYLGSNHDNSTNTPAAEAANAVKTIAVKCNDVLRYQTNGSNFPENVKYHCIVVADNGNAAGSVSTLLTIFSPEANSGCQFNAHSRFWYVDN